MDNIQDFINQNYLWIKSLHLIFVISWMVGLLYLPRLFVYHANTKKGSESAEMLKIMEYRLQKFIMNPAMILTIFFGFLLLLVEGVVDWNNTWIYIKLFSVVGLIGIHHYLSKLRKIFDQDKNIHSAKYYKFLNEAPTILLIVIIIMVYIKPF